MECLKYNAFNFTNYYYFIAISKLHTHVKNLILKEFTNLSHFNNDIDMAFQATTKNTITFP